MLVWMQGTDQPCAPWGSEPAGGILSSSQIADADAGLGALSGLTPALLNRLDGRLASPVVSSAPGADASQPRRCATHVDGSGVRCFNEYSELYADDFDFGDLSVFSAGFRWREDSSKAPAFVESQLTIYDNQGYEIELSASHSEARTQLRALQEAGWIDAATRAVLVDFTLLNRNYQNLLSVRLIINMHPSGAIHCESKMLPLRLSAYGYPSANPGREAELIACDAFCLVYCALLLYWAAGKITVYGAAAFFGTLWNVLDVVVALLVFGAATIRAIGSANADAYLSLVQMPQFHRFDTRASFATAAGYVLVLTAALSIVNLLKHFQANRSVSKLWRVLVLMRLHIGVFFFVFGVLCMALGLAIFTRFGMRTPELASFSRSLIFATSTVITRTQEIYEHLREIAPIASFIVECATWTLNTVMLFLLLALFVAGYLQVHSFERSQVRRHGDEAVTTTENSIMFWKVFLFMGWWSVLEEIGGWMRRKLSRKRRRVA
jgi:hypothetical protein